MDWRDFFDRDHSIYVSERHKLLHARIIARDTVALVPRPDAQVLDFGCGEALHAEAVAAACGKLILTDAAPNLRAELSRRFTANPKVSVLPPETLDLGVPDDSLDLVTVISVSQYLSREALAENLSLFLAKLKPGGIVVVGDVIPPDVGMVTDTRALLSFAWTGGFLVAALAGLVKTAFSNYRTLREKLGLTFYTAAEMDTALHKAGFAAVRRRDNIGHNPARMTFVAQKRP
jgi:ubiquinone/menaquinone biosynthesis C-methylase UbiE